MLKTRRQRSSWARIKLSIILFQTPRRVSDLNNFKPVPFLIFRNVDLREKKNNSIRVIIHHFTPLFLPFFVLRLFSLPKIFALWLILLSLPFNFKDQLRALHYSSAPQAKKNVSQNCLFCQAPFAFFLFLFFQVFTRFSTQSKTKKQRHFSNTYPPSRRNMQNRHVLPFSKNTCVDAIM